MQKIPAYITAVGALLIVVAVAFFSFTGSGFGGDLLFKAAGLAAGMVLALLLTRSPRRGRIVAALLLALLAVGCLALVLAAPDSLVAFAENNRGWARRRG